jgi:hypothetical protein
MGLFHHHAGIESEYITHFHIAHGDREAGLAWDLRDGDTREIAVFRSAQGFVEEGVDPMTDGRQTLVYQGADRHVRLVDQHLENGIAYYYTVFARGDDGDWHLQLTDTVAPEGSSHWKRAGYEGESESQQRAFDLDFDSWTLGR